MPIMLKRARIWAVAMLALAGIGLALSWVVLPTYAARFILISDVEISDVRLVLERQPRIQAFPSRAFDRVFAWDAVVARGTRPRPLVEVTWRGPDGRHRSLRQVVVHEDAAPRCLHILRLDASAAPLPGGLLPSGEPMLIESLCR